jgi:copper homeostasis protein
MPPRHHNATIILLVPLLFLLQIFKAEGVAGVVFGILQPDGCVDMERMRELVQLARPLKVTFHRAFDMVKEPFQAMEDIISLGIERILTSGCDSTCLEGLGVLSELVKRAGDRIIIMPGGGITERNIQTILSGCKASEFHVSGRTNRDSRMEYRNENCYMGGVLRPPEFTVSVVSENRVRAFLQTHLGC